MRASPQLSRPRPRFGLAGLVALVMVLAAVPSALARGGHRTLHYHGYTLRVPAAWPVFDLRRDPATCVRFDRHAVYLGAPSARQSCPAHAAGRTEAILVQPVAAAAAAGPHGRLAPGAGRIDTFTTGRVLVTATWAGDRSGLAAIVAHRLTATAPDTRRPRRVRPRATRPSGRFRTAQAIYAGKGFDACSTPAASTMNAWGVSPYRSIGIYIGGVNAACTQPNLNSAWTSQETAAGWNMLPLYVGLQAPGACSGTCASITPSEASSQGAAAADDAVNQARAVGLAAGNPIFNDMEQYNRTSTNSMTVLGFLQGWTQELHALGYQSGVYSSGSSGIADLVAQYGTGYPEPDEIWVAHWNGQATTSDAYVPSSDWTGATRIHQYEGGHNETYGGVTINIDSDYLDASTATANPTSPFPDGTFIQANGDPNVYRVAGGAAMFVSNWSGFGGAQPVTMTTSQQLAALPPYPANGTFITTTTGQSYRVAGGAAFAITDWSLFGGQQPSVTIDEWDLQNIGNPIDHLLAAPAIGTTVEGLPSGSFWTFVSGGRTQTQSTPGAVAVEDQALSGYPVVANSGGVGQPHVAAVRCVAPHLKHLSLVRTRGALRRAHCRLGKVRRPRRWGRHHLLRVFGQSTRPGSAHVNGYKINIRML